MAATDQIAGHSVHLSRRERASTIVSVLITLIVALIGLTSAEALVRIAADQERPSHTQEVVFRSALCGFLGTAAYLAGLSADQEQAEATTG
jgi:hypothetical protein